MKKEELNIKIKGKALVQLEELQKRTNSNSKTEVVNKALRVYSAIQKYVRDDGSIIVIYKPSRFLSSKKIQIFLP